MNSYPEINRDIVYLVRKYAIGLYRDFHGAIDVEDFEQELLFAVVVSLQQFDFKKGNILSFANRCLFTKSAEIKRSLLRDKRKAFLFSTPICESTIRHDNYCHYAELLDFLPPGFRKIAEEIQYGIVQNSSLSQEEFETILKIFKQAKKKKGVHMKNISCIETLSIRELSKLNEADLYDLSIKIDETSKWIKSLVEKFETALTTKYAEEARKKINEDNADFGTCKLQKGKYTVNVQMPKKVQWDQKILADIYSRNIPEAQNLFRVSYNIYEKDYARLSPALLQLVEPARTTVYGKIKVTVEENEATNENN